ncbi:hypothetical protein VHEMI10413 [[Torrubiella] hemipterigena]|uniref:NAD-dependent epimerase/dehydratase domain-containing protein n=1 Tax=[Torrubiella] hemipterigena TaxID=1531966 RepID=A0A0A1TCY1_9HYPO|nr:hypothetical protein VHEMI10413 [[Torrubiella] hemipterigena]
MSVYSESSSNSAPGDVSPTSFSGNATPLTAPSVAADFTSQLEGQLPPPKGDEYILVIGGLGFIGSHTTLELLKEGYNVIIVDNLSNAFESVYSKIQTAAAAYYKGSSFRQPSLYLHTFDYQSKSMRCLLEMYSAPVPVASTDSNNNSAHATFTRKSQISGVIHFAAYKSVPQSIARPIQYYQNNVCGLVDLMELLGEYNIRRFVFSSSATVYGSKADAGKLLREEDLVHHAEVYTDEQGNAVHAEPVVSGLGCPYARTKYFCEAILADIAVADPEWRIVCLRYFNPIGCDSSGQLGEDPKGIPTNLFPVITQVMTGRRKELSVFGSDWDTRDGTPIRDYVHVSDVARGHTAALNCKNLSPFRTYNLGSGTGTTVIEAVKALEAASNKSIPMALVGRREGDVGFCVASKSRAADELGWTAKESINTCAEDLWRYVSKHTETA